MIHEREEQNVVRKEQVGISQEERTFYFDNLDINNQYITNIEDNQVNQEESKEDVDNNKL